MRFFRFVERPRYNTLGVESEVSLDYFAVVRGDVIPEEPLRYRQIAGRYLWDMVWTSDPALKLISPQCCALLAKHRCTGYRMLHTTIEHRQLGLIEGYGLLTVSGRAGPVHYDKARREWREPRVPGAPPRKVGVGMHFDVDTWSGHDFFLFGDSGHIAVTERVKEALSAIKLKNIDITPLEEVEITGIQVLLGIRDDEDWPGMPPPRQV